MPLYSTRAGVARGNAGTLELLDIPEPDLGAVIAAGTLERAKSAPARESIDFAAADLLAPIPDPGEFALTGLNYRSHCEEIGHAVPTELPFGLIPAIAVNHPGASIVIPSEAPAHVDYEGEIGIIIGRHADNVAAADAWDYIAGLCACNDVSARDVQAGGMAAIPKAKGFPSFKPFGPGLLTVDELTLPLDISVKTWVNGELRQSSRSTDMIFGVPQVVEAMSARKPLEPGTLILSGTPSGVAHGGKFPFLKPGDVVEVEIEGLPRLINPVVAA